MKQEVKNKELNFRDFYEKKHTDEDTRYFELYVPYVINKHFSDSDILDLGSGKQTRNIALDKTRVIYSDISLKAMQFVKKASPFSNCVVLDAEALPFKGGVFSSILCKDILEHVPEDKKVVREVYRCLKPGGVVGIWVPATLEEEEAFRWGHLRAYTFDSLQELFHEFRPGYIAANRIWKGRKVYTDLVMNMLVRYLLFLFDKLHWERKGGYRALCRKFSCRPKEYCLYLFEKYFERPILAIFPSLGTTIVAIFYKKM